MKSFFIPGAIILSVLGFTTFVALTHPSLAEENGLNPFKKDKLDEAMISHLSGNFSDGDLKKLIAGADEDYFQDMDYGVTRPENRKTLRESLVKFFPGITEDEAGRRMARGRNNWIVFSGGNDQFWSNLNKSTLGSLDLIKTVSDEPSLPATRSNRWQELGLVNEPCYSKATASNPDLFGLWIPKRDPNCPPDPFENESKYPGVKIGARGMTVTYHDSFSNVDRNAKVEVGSSYGYASGVIGLRLFPNPDFNQEAAKKWDPVRYYRDPNYYTDPKLVRPYRMGMACAFCHVGPNPSRPPEDFEAPKWANLNSNPGAQYFWFDRIFAWDWKAHPESFVLQLLHSSRPGALDTSLVTSDQIVNPRTMNALYDVPARIDAMTKFAHAERLVGGQLDNKQFTKLAESVVSADSPLRKSYSADTQTVISPHVLKDGSDSVGMLGALNRVYVNIGLFSEEWLEHFIPLIGGPKITPFPIAKAEKNSLYWKALVEQTPDVALFFIAATRPDLLAEAPGGNAYLQPDDSAQIKLGKRVFAENCAACHSSKLPPKAYTFFNKGDMSCDGANYLTCWNSYWAYTHTSEFKDEMQKVIEEPDFLKGNYLSTDLRVPVTLTDSQLCSPIGTNAIRGDMWDNFSSETYKTLPGVGKFVVNYPSPDGKNMLNKSVDVPAGGRGYLRPPSLISVWSSAPLLQNNTLGRFDWHGTVAGRMKSFDDSIHQLLNPETRSKGDDSGYHDQGRVAMPFKTQFGDTLTGIVDVMDRDSYANLPKKYVPEFAQPILRKFAADEAKKPNKLYADHPILIQGPAIPEPTSFEVVPKKNWLERTIASIFGGNKPEPKREIASVQDATEPYFQLGPIPKGVPVNLIANLDLDPKRLLQQGEAVVALVGAVKEIRDNHLTGEAARLAFMKRAAAPLLKASKCPDFVVNRGHYFGTQYSEDAKTGKSKPLNTEEKTALIEYLKKM